MAETPDQARPLAPATDRPTSSDEDDNSSSSPAKSHHRKRWVKCCVILSALLAVQAAVVVALVFTIFRVRDPIISMNSVAVERMDLVNGTNMPRPGSNMTLRADVSVKNPNYASFRYRNTTTAIYYRGVVIGEARGPEGRARARRTMRMNVTVEVMTDRVLTQPELGSDIGSGVLTMGSYTVVGGRVKVMMIKRHVTVMMNCSMTVNVSSQSLQTMRCRRKVTL